jgi:two-component system, sensor histidine kinase
VLNDLLDISKIEAGRLELEQAPFDLEEVAQGAYATFTGVANIGGVSFAMTIAPEAKGRWLGDSVRVRQVLYNLISNALKFTSEGEVRVAVEATSDGGVKGLLIRVSDTGIGIAPDVLPRLFEKFVQADNSTTRRFGGTGLGLTICRHIVELMGGTIEAESRPGVGTTFSVALPLPWVSPAITLLSPPAATDIATESDCGFEDLRILAAEDNATNQLVLKTVLHSMGLAPLIVQNGREAVEAWASGRFDLVLMDIQMPVMDGIAATREIRRREAETGCGHTRIVALSANAMKHQVSEYLAAGMDGHLAKPLQIEKLYEVLLGVGAEAQTDLAA